MNHIKNKKGYAGIVALLLITVIMGTTFAYFRAETKSDNKITSGNIGISLIDTTSNENVLEDEQSILFGLRYPGDKIDKQTFIKNTSDNPLYARIRVDKYWADDSEKKVIEAKSNYIDLITNDTSHWIIQEDEKNSEYVYFYYRNPIESQQSSKNLVDQIGISGRITNNEEIDYTDLQIVLSFEAEAIQKVGAKQAILSQWGLDVEFDENGRMTEIER